MSAPPPPPPRVLGYYIHHQGRGHLHRAMAVAAAASRPVVGLSSLDRPSGWTGPWVNLTPDHPGSADHATAGGRLHWAPLGHVGLRARMAEISAWIKDRNPVAMVVDVSVEVALLSRLHGVPVVTVVQPGDRTDPAHETGYAVSEALVACWPPGVDAARLPETVERGRLHEVGAISRFPVRVPSGAGRRTGECPHVVVLVGAGGEDVTAAEIDELEDLRPTYRWTVLGGPGAWVEDPVEVLSGADVVVTHGGQNAIAEVAALRVPAVVVARSRPHEEQQHLARALGQGPWPVSVASGPADIVAAVDRMLCASGDRWTGWCDGQAARRFVEVCESVVHG